MPPRLVLIDTSALYALVDRDAPDHASVVSAVAQLTDAGATLLVLDPTFGATMSLLKARLGAATAVAVGESLRASRIARLVPVDAGDVEAAWHVFRRYAEREWSFGDCLSLAYMRVHDIPEVVTTDPGVRDMGVVCWPRATDVALTQGTLPANL